MKVSKGAITDLPIVNTNRCENTRLHAPCDVVNVPGSTEYNKTRQVKLPVSVPRTNDDSQTWMSEDSEGASSVYRNDVLKCVNLTCNFVFDCAHE
jgi:hypothetical protein